MPPFHLLTTIRTLLELGEVERMLVLKRKWPADCLYLIISYNACVSC